MDPHPNQTTADWPRRVIVPTMPNPESGADAPAPSNKEDDEGSGTQKGMIFTELLPEIDAMVTREDEKNEMAAAQQSQ